MLASIYNTIIIVFIVIITGSTGLIAQVTATAATGGTGISADDTGLNWTTLTDPVLTEGTKNDFAVGTVTFTAPSGFEWDTAATITITIVPNGPRTTKLLMSQGTHTASVLTFNITQQSGAKGGKEPAIVTFAGIQVRPSTGIVSSGDITWAGTAYTPGSALVGPLTMVPGAFTPTTSPIILSDRYILNDGSSTSLITVQLKDQYNNNLISGGETVVINATGGTLLSTISDNADGSYTQSLQSTTLEEYADISATVNAGALPSTSFVGFTPSTTVWASDGTNSTAWSTTGNWTNGVPTNTSVVLIPVTPLNGTGYPIGDNSASTGEMIIESGATFTLSGGISFTVNGTLRGLGAVTGSASDNLSLNGDLDITTIGLGTLTLTGSGTQSIIQSYVFTNLTVNKTGLANVQADLSVSGTLTLTAGILVMTSGTNFNAGTTSETGGNLRFERELTGSPGWRLMSSPAASTYGDIFDKIFTQGYTGSSDDTLSPSILYYDESFVGTDNQRWRKPGNSTDNLVAGRGHFVYVFGSTSDPLYNIAFPVTIDVDGSENEGVASEFDFAPTYTATADTGWNLVGNPFGTTIDWDLTWTKTNMDNVIYIWDPSANGGSGSYLTWNGTTGSLGDGIIAPFQGFWVKANAASPVLKVNYSAKTQGTNFIGKTVKEIPNFYISASSDQFLEKIFFMFSNDGKLAEDPLDAYWLTPPADSYLEFNSLRNSKDRMVIQNLPLKFGTLLEIPINTNLVLGDMQKAADIELQWGNLNSLPAEWDIYLVNNSGNETIDLRRETFASMKSFIDPSARVNKINSNSMLPSTKARFSGKTSYTLVIDPGSSFPEIPREMALKNNFPNPFNSHTTFSFLIPLESTVTFAIYDILGRNVKTLLDDQLVPAGEHIFKWHAGNMPTGVYFSQLIVNNNVYTKKIMLVK